MTSWSGVIQPLRSKIRATMRCAERMVQWSKNICDFWPVVPEEVRCSSTSSRGIESTSWRLKKFAWTSGVRYGSAGGVASYRERKNAERSVCQALVSAMAAANSSSTAGPWA